MNTIIENQSQQNQNPIYLAVIRTARIAEVFCAIVITLLLANAIRARLSDDPLLPARLDTMRVQLSKNPSDEALKTRIRRMDLNLRRQYFGTRQFAQNGLLLLTGGILVYLGALEGLRYFRRTVAVPAPGAGEVNWLTSALARRSVMALGGAMAGVLLTLTVVSRHDVTAEYAKWADAGWPAPVTAHSEGNQISASVVSPPGIAPAPGGIAPAPGGIASAPAGGLPGGLAPIGGAAAPVPMPLKIGAPITFGGGPAAVTGNTSNPVAPANNSHPAPTGAVGAIVAAVPAEWNAQWPAFRGAAGAGITASLSAPTSWNGEKKQNVLWKSPVPLPGWNSPIVWKDKVFLTGATKTKKDIYCYDSNSGKLLWQLPVSFPALTADFSVSDDTGFAPNTMATDGKLVYAIFVDGTLIAAGLDGKPKWQLQLGAPENSYGHAASLRLASGKLIVQYDQGSSANDGKSSLIALDASNGKPMWQTPRAVPNSWSTPLIIQTGKQEQIITCANPFVIAYNLADGKEIWRAEVLGGEVAPSPIWAGGYVITCNQGAAMAAIRPDGTGNVTKSHVVWTTMEGLPDITSPVSDGSRIYTFTTEGQVTCIDAKTGKKVWDQFIKATFKSSPVVAGTRLYEMDNKGVMHILQAGSKFKQIATAPIGEESNAVPAFVGGRIYIRGKNNIFCVGK